MPIPAEILAVERPVNTVVIAYGKNKDKFAVRQRVGCRNVNGRHLPVNGPTIGHIEGGRYIPIDADPVRSVSKSPIDLKDWAGIVLCDREFRFILDELRRFYNREDALAIYCISILRVCNHGIKDYELGEAYETSFLSELYPGIPFSKNTVSKFLNNLGKACSRISLFMKSRAEAVNIDHHLLVDGTLKSDESKVNSLSDFSRKARTKGSRDISVLYAYDLEEMEPVCSKCFPGNMLDETAYDDFIRENGITKGIIVGDKGFPSSAASDEFASHPDLHYMNPVKRNSKLIAEYSLLDYTGILPGYENVTYRKEKYTGAEKWLYAFRDSYRAAKEEGDWLHNAKKNGSYSLEVLRKKQKVFGVVVLESDIDLAPETAYKTYSSRWEIEVFMRYYKSACCFDETRVHDDYSVIGSEFCDFLSTLLSAKLIKAFDRAKILEQMTYKKAMAILTRAKKVRIGKTDWQLVKTTPSHIRVLEGLSLLPKPEEPVKRKRGRPRKTQV